MSDTDTQFWFAASSEEFPPSQMLEQAPAAEEAGFDGTASSDHFALVPRRRRQPGVGLPRRRRPADDRAARDQRRPRAAGSASTCTEDIHDPAETVRMADERMSDEQFAHEGFLVGADPEEHIARLREMLELGPTVVCLQGIGDADPLGSIRRYGEEVLPALRRARV